ncbi:MAG: hypothetical protein P1S60_00680 [Anaerolineae bacterium]|nr:hypothetical protein [Anaerolineae bacterium]
MNRTQREIEFPNRISTIILLSLRDVIGDNGMNAVLNTGNLAHLIEAALGVDFGPGLSFREVGDLFDALESIYGVRTAEKYAREAGQRGFKYWIQGFGGAMSMADIVLRFLPLFFRARLGVQIFTEIFNRYTALNVSVDENHENYFLTIEPGGFCCGRNTDIPACDYVVGLLDEVLFWISRGHRFRIEETSCMACGDPICTFNIIKQVMD